MDRVHFDVWVDLALECNMFLLSSVVVSLYNDDVCWKVFVVIVVVVVVPGEQ